MPLTVNLPRTPYSFLAYRTANLALSTSDFRTLVCDGEFYDFGGVYNSTSGVFTAPVTGHYRFKASLQFNDNEWVTAWWTTTDNTFGLANQQLGKGHNDSFSNSHTIRDYGTVFPMVAGSSVSFTYYLHTPPATLMGTTTPGAADYTWHYGALLGRF